MKFIKSLLYFLSSVIISYITWLIFYYLTPFLINLSWIWIVLALLIGGGFAIPLIGALPGIMSMLVIKLRSYSKFESFIVAVIVLFFGFSSVRMAWTFNFSYSSNQIFAAIVQNITALGVFWGIFLSLVTKNDDI